MRSARLMRAGDGIRRGATQVIVHGLAFTVGEQVDQTHRLGVVHVGGEVVMADGALLDRVVEEGGDVCAVAGGRSDLGCDAPGVVYMLAAQARLLIAEERFEQRVRFVVGDHIVRPAALL